MNAGRDPYHRRREAGQASREETRRRLLIAADALFRQRGYVATPVSEIAERAGVSLQTLYSAWGSKRALLRASVNAAVSASFLPVEPADWREQLRAELREESGGASTAPAYVAAFTRVFCRIAGRAAPYWRIQQQAAVVDDEIAGDWQALLGNRRDTMAVIADDLPRVGCRPGLTTAVVRDLLWSLASPQMYDLLTVAGGYTPAKFQAWLQGNLIQLLCAEDK